MISVNPVRIYGEWVEGYALDVHSLSSTLVGQNEHGHKQFDTKRSELGEFLYKLKYNSDKSALTSIVDAVSDFVTKGWGIINSIDMIIPVPLSNRNRAYQPVIEIAKATSHRLQIPFHDDLLIKTKETPELKGINEYHQRIEVLVDAFAVKDMTCWNKRTLLFDDLYRSGATLTVLTRALYEQAKVQSVYVLTLTRTRSKR